MSREGMTELWISRIADFRASGETVVAWGKRQQVSPKQFCYWMRKLKLADEQTPSASSPKWVALSVGASAPAEVPAISVRVGTVTVEVRPGFEPNPKDPAALDRLLPWSKTLPVTCRLAHS